jgi:hypothetical protein
MSGQGGEQGFYGFGGMQDGETRFIPIWGMGSGVPSAPQYPQAGGWPQQQPWSKPTGPATYGYPTYGTPMPGVPGQEWVQPPWTPMPGAGYEAGGLESQYETLPGYDYARDFPQHSVPSDDFFHEPRVGFPSKHMVSHFADISHPTALFDEEESYVYNGFIPGDIEDGNEEVGLYGVTSAFDRLDCENEMLEDSKRLVESNKAWVRTAGFMGIRKLTPGKENLIEILGKYIETEKDEGIKSMLERWVKEIARERMAELLLQND